MATQVGSFLHRDVSDGARPINGRSISGSTRGQSLAQGMGWFSIGLGAAQLIAPRAMSRLIGLEESDRNAAIMRAIGAREVAGGLGLFSQRNDAAFMWGRVVGDFMDLALIGAASTSARSDRRKLAGAALAVAGALALDVVTARQRSQPEVTDLAPSTADEWDESEQLEQDEARHVSKVITISRPPDEVSSMWAELVQRPDVEGLADADVSFGPSPRGGTEVRVQVRYEPRLGRVGAAVSKLRRNDPASRLTQGLRHAKQIIEVGEIVHSDASIHRGLHPAQPDMEARR